MYQIPTNGAFFRPIVPVPKIESSDIFSGEAGYSSVYCESDYVMNKPMCDVVFKAHGYPTVSEKSNFTVRAKVGDMNKIIDIKLPRV